MARQGARHEATTNDHVVIDRGWDHGKAGSTYRRNDHGLVARQSIRVFLARKSVPL